MILGSRPLDDLLEWWRGPAEERGERFACTWIGQAGFLLRFGNVRVVVDPYLSDSLAIKYGGTHFPHERMVPVPVDPAALTDVDVVLCTHEHTDHMDAVTLREIARASRRATFVIPRYSLDSARDRGVPVERCVAVNMDETIQLPGGLTVTALPAAHEDFVRDQAGNSKFLGYLFECAGAGVFHSGDTVPFAGLEERLARCAPIDVALLPVNGRDEERRTRGVPGNMTVREALQYHGRFAFGTTLVHHFGMFAFNTVPPAALAREIEAHMVSYPEQGSIIIPEAGTLYERQE